MGMGTRAASPSVGQTYLLLLFAAFFAWIAPLICWGGVADPSHGHAVAHFVFSEPRSIGHHLKTDCAEAGRARGLPRSLEALNLLNQSKEATPSGPARPATVLSTLLISLLFVPISCTYRPRITLQPAPIVPLAFTLALPVQTPPPR